MKFFQTDGNLAYCSNVDWRLTMGCLHIIEKRLLFIDSWNYNLKCVPLFHNADVYMNQSHWDSR